MITRRRMLSSGLKCAALGAGTISSCHAYALPVSTGSLKEGVVDCGLQVGIAVDNISLENRQFAQAVLSNFSLLTVSGMKWDRVHPQPEVFNFSDADAGLQFARVNRLRVHGHNLCWNSPDGTPAWVKTVNSRSNAERLLVDHIHAVAGRYKGRIDSWDVVNEPLVGWSKRPDLLYPGIWTELFGSEYIDIAFRATAEADPEALRVLNIYHVEQGTDDGVRTRVATLGLLKQLMERGVPVQAIGLESHLDVTQPLGAASLAEFLKDVKQLGLDVMITELDVMESRASGNSMDWDRQVADLYGEYLESVLPYTGTKRVIFWSLQDRWVGQRRVQGLLQSSFTPRLSWETAHAALKRACWHS